MKKASIIKMVSAILLFFGIWFFIGSLQTAYAEGEIVDSGVYDGVPWRLTTTQWDDEYDLFIGEEGQTYFFDYREKRDADDYPWNAYSLYLNEAKIEGKVYGNGSMSSMFYRLFLKNIVDLRNFDTSRVTDMSWMFYDCGSNLMTSLDVSGFDTSHVTNMQGMFSYCGDKESIDVSGFDTSSVTDMSDMFSHTHITDLDLSHFDTSSVTDMSNMFSGIYVTVLDLGGFDTSNVIKMNGMFSGCDYLTNVDLSSFDTSKVTEMCWMFEGSTSLTELNLSGFDTSSVVDMQFMFSRCEALTTLNVNGFNTKNVKLMNNMFHYTSLSELDLSCFDTSNCVSMENMFAGTRLSVLKVGKGFNTPDDYRSYAAFPVDMYDSKTGIKYEEGDYIPNRDYRTYLAEPEEIPEDYFPKGDITFHYDTSYEEGMSSQETVYYDNDFFSADNGKYNQKLATASLGLAMAGMRKDFVYDFLEDCAFRNIYQSPRFETPLTDDQDKVAFTLATKKVEGRTVVAVVLRGGNYGNEWGSNGRVGLMAESLGYHYGFNTAAEDVLEQLEAYCGEKERVDLENAKIWLTGYSRSAAVANCLGSMLEQQGLIDKSNLYCYTFATPRTVTEGKVYKSTRGIYNIINPLDLVTCVPLNSSTCVSARTLIVSFGTIKPWDYTRHGETLELPSALSTYRYWNILKDMEEEFQAITAYEKQYTRFPGLALQDILDILSSTTMTETFYVVNLQDQIVVPALELFMAPNHITDDAAVLAVISRLPGARTMLRKMGFTDGIVSSSSVKLSSYKDLSMMKQHWPETYLAWMRTGNEPKKPTAFKSILVQCPVDVEVFDADHNLVARITDDQIDESIDGHLEAYVDKAGAKSIAMPADGEYTIKLSATDDGTMTYSVKETDEEKQIVRKIIYENVTIKKGQEFTGEVNTGINTETDNYNLQTDGETIAYNKEYSGAQLGTVEVKVDVSGLGVVTGNGNYTVGDSVVLEAFENDDSVFEGWYQNGAMISNDNTLTLVAETDTSYVARFGKASIITTDISDTYVHGIKNKAYTGKALTQTFTVETADKVLEKGTDYTVEYVNNKNVGWAEVIITGVGDYTGTRTEYFQIKPKGTTLNKPARGRRAVTVKWKKQSAKMSKSRITGYQVQVALNSSFTKGKKSAFVKGYSKTSKKFIKLKSRKKYYVRVRTYKTVYGSKIYSPWSKKKYVKTK